MSPKIKATVIIQPRFECCLNWPVFSKWDLTLDGTSKLKSNPANRKKMHRPICSAGFCATKIDGIEMIPQRSMTFFLPDKNDFNFDCTFISRASVSFLRLLRQIAIQSNVYDKCAISGSRCFRFIIAADIRRYARKTLKAPIRSSHFR